MGYNQRKDIIYDTMHSMGRDWELVARYDNSRGPAMYLRELTPLLIGSSLTFYFILCPDEY